MNNEAFRERRDRHFPLAQAIGTFVHNALLRVTWNGPVRVHRVYRRLRQFNKFPADVERAGNRGGIDFHLRETVILPRPDVFTKCLMMSVRQWAYFRPSRLPYTVWTPIVRHVVMGTLELDQSSPTDRWNPLQVYPAFSHHLPSLP